MTSDGGKALNKRYRAPRVYTADEITAFRRAFLDVFEYKEGMLFWRVKVSDKVNVGDRAGSLMRGVGRRRIRLNNVVWQEHRVIYLMIHGYLPNEIDHIDCNPLNNKIENLRPATRLSNAWNQRVSTRNRSGFKNVHWKKDKRKWKVEVRSENTVHFVGYFDDVEKANLAAIAARNHFHKEFANHG